MLYETAASSDQAVVTRVPAGDEQPPSLDALFSPQPAETIEAGGALFWQDEQADHVFLAVEGVFRIVRILSDGRRGITGFIYPGDLIGASLRGRYPYAVEAVTNARVRRIGRRRFQSHIGTSSELLPELFARMCDELAEAQDRMVMLARKTAEERVCSFLLSTARQTGGARSDSPVVAIPMTRLDIADYLGLTIETVSRTMSRLMSCGVIRPAGRHAVAVRDADELAALAGEGDENASRARRRLMAH
ncbi:MAG: hypothetical protein BGP06_07880 [Rhizobiales bacterium 65-9]|nr:helix-turn-helix domain-containing protein [Hyphomicrobiales bacterium]OJY33789.1 MAG: hypothetical protein BGP06_07880 [Rhizobiales bacterium 65-9]